MVVFEVIVDICSHCRGIFALSQIGEITGHCGSAHTPCAGVFFLIAADEIARRIIDIRAGDSRVALEHSADAENIRNAVLIRGNIDRFVFLSQHCQLLRRCKLHDLRNRADAHAEHGKTAYLFGSFLYCGKLLLSQAAHDAAHDLFNAQQRLSGGDALCADGNTGHLAALRKDRDGCPIAIEAEHRNGDIAVVLRVAQQQIALCKEAVDEGLFQFGGLCRVQLDRDSFGSGLARLQRQQTVQRCLCSQGLLSLNDHHAVLFDGRIGGEGDLCAAEGHILIADIGQRNVKAEGIADIVIEVDLGFAVAAGQQHLVADRVVQRDQTCALLSRGSIHLTGLIRNCGGHQHVAHILRTFRAGQRASDRIKILVEDCHTAGEIRGRHRGTLHQLCTAVIRSGFDHAADAHDVRAELQTLLDAPA